MLFWCASVTASSVPSFAYPNMMIWSPVLTPRSSLPSSLPPEMSRFCVLMPNPLSLELSWCFLAGGNLSSPLLGCALLLGDRSCPVSSSCPQVSPPARAPLAHVTSCVVGPSSPEGGRCSRVDPRVLFQTLLHVQRVVRWLLSPATLPSAPCAWVCPPALKRRDSLWQRVLCCCGNRHGVGASCPSLSWSSLVRVPARVCDRAS